VPLLLEVLHVLRLLLLLLLLLRYPLLLYHELLPLLLLL
jgi:hypothetical protein